MFEDVSSNKKQNNYDKTKIISEAETTFEYLNIYILSTNNVISLF